jgi:hypothetical protein
MKYQEATRLYLLHRKLTQKAENEQIAMNFFSILMLPIIGDRRKFLTELENILNFMNYQEKRVQKIKRTIMVHYSV